MHNHVVIIFHIKISDIDRFIAEVTERDAQMKTEIDCENVFLMKICICISIRNITFSHAIQIKIFFNFELKLMSAIIFAQIHDEMCL